MWRSARRNSWGGVLEDVASAGFEGSSGIRCARAQRQSGMLACHREVGRQLVTAS